MHKAPHDEIRLWLCDNAFTIKELLVPLLIQKTEALKTYDGVFHHEINKQFESLALSIIGIEITKQTGCSVEEYYDIIEECNLNNLFNRIDDWRQNDQD
jgi:hypothetical protein